MSGMVHVCHRDAACPVAADIGHTDGQEVCVISAMKTNHAQLSITEYVFSHREGHDGRRRPVDRSKTRKIPSGARGGHSVHIRATVSLDAMDVHQIAAAMMERDTARVGGGTLALGEEDAEVSLDRAGGGGARHERRCIEDDMAMHAIVNKLVSMVPERAWFKDALNAVNARVRKHVGEHVTKCTESDAMPILLPTLIAYTGKQLSDVVAAWAGRNQVTPVVIDVIREWAAARCRALWARFQPILQARARGRMSSQQRVSGEPVPARMPAAASARGFRGRGKRHSTSSSNSPSKYWFMDHCQAVVYESVNGVPWSGGEGKYAISPIPLLGHIVPSQRIIDRVFKDDSRVSVDKRSLTRCCRFVRAWVFDTASPDEKRAMSDVLAPLDAPFRARLECALNTQDAAH